MGAGARGSAKVTVIASIKEGKLENEILKSLLPFGCKSENPLYS